MLICHSSLIDSSTTDGHTTNCTPVHCVVRLPWICMHSMYIYERACGTLLHMQHWSDLQVPLTVVGPSQNKGPDVHWDKVSDLKTGTRYKYINYTDVIEMERLPAISPFTNEVRETISSVCAIVASCHMTHITACHINSIVLLLYTQYAGALHVCKTAKRWVSMRVL